MANKTRPAGYRVLAYGQGAAIELPEQLAEEARSRPVFQQYECELMDTDDWLDEFIEGLHE